MNVKSERGPGTALSLTAEDVRELEAVGSTVVGERYPEGGMRAVNR